MAWLLYPDRLSENGRKSRSASVSRQTARRAYRAGGSDNGAVRIGQEDVLVVRLAGVFEGGTTEQAEKVAFVRTVVAVEVGEQAVYFVIVDEYAPGIVAQSGHKGLDGGVDYHVTLALWHFHFFGQRLLLALFGGQPLPFAVLPDFLCIDTV